MNALALLGLASKSEVDALKKELAALKKIVHTNHKNKNGLTIDFTDQDPLEFAGMGNAAEFQAADKTKLLKDFGFAE